jgi:hypothetical protein
MKIYVSRKPATLLNEVYILSEEAQYMAYYTFRESGEMIGTTFKYGDMAEQVKPAFIVPEREWRDMLAAFSEEAKAVGVENKSETFNKGKLEATERHLNDLRALVFKKK